MVRDLKQIGPDKTQTLEVLGTRSLLKVVVTNSEPKAWAWPPPIKKIRRCR